MKQRYAWSLTEEQLAYLAEHYHNTPNEELAETLGISVHTINSRRTRHGWRKDADYLKKVGHETAVANEAWKRLNVEKNHAKGIATRNKIYEAERVRIKWGLPQLTKRHFRTELRETQVQRNYLKRLGYIIDDAGLIAYYTPDTHRARRLERVERGVRKGSIKPFYTFKPYERQRKPQDIQVPNGPDPGMDAIREADNAS